MPRINSSGWKSGDLRIWSGTLLDIPNGWELASEMLDRVPVGAGNAYTKGEKFGSQYKATESKTLSEEQLPSHAHSTVVKSASGGLSYYGGAPNSGSSKLMYLGATGGSAAHDHGNIDVTQPSIGVIWIRKL